jgi:hypothetical protein
MRRILAAALFLTCFAIPPVDLLFAATKPKTVVVRGQVTDPEGNGVAGVPVRAIATRRIVKFLTVESQPAQKEVVSTNTDANGFYELTLPKLRDYDYYFLRFHDPVQFDAVKFAVPEDVEITNRIQKRRPVVEDFVLDFSPQWDAVQRLVELYGASTTRGKIVRQLGVPDRTDHTATESGVERETWWFDAAGVAYVIEDGRVVEKKTFQPERESDSIAHQ